MWKQRLLFLCIAGLLLWGMQPATILPAEAAAELTGETKYIAITFDDGPRRNTTARLLDGLQARGASATFFLLGSNIEGNEDLLLRMQAEGHQVGNHTWGHVQLKGASGDVIETEIGQTDALLRKTLGEGTYWLRPPYGLITEAEKKLVPVPMVQWSVDPMDWDSLNTRKVVCAVLAAAGPGDIILLHDPCPTSVDAALQIVDALQAQGYWFVTVEELLALNGMEVKAGEIYLRAE